MDPGKDAGDVLSTFEVTRSATVRWLVRLWWTVTALDGLVPLAALAKDPVPKHRRA